MSFLFFLSLIICRIQQIRCTNTSTHKKHKQSTNPNFSHPVYFQNHATPTRNCHRPNGDANDAFASRPNINPHRRAASVASAAAAALAAAVATPTVKRIPYVRWPIRMAAPPHHRRWQRCRRRHRQRHQCRCPPKRRWTCPASRRRRRTENRCPVRNSPII